MDKKSPASNPQKNESPEASKTPNENEEDNLNTSLAAKGSEWIGMKTQFRRNSCRSPVECLFPGIRSVDGESTTVITKLLKGKKPDPDALPLKTGRHIWTNPLASVNERPTDELTSDISISIARFNENQTESDGQDYDDDDEPKRATHTKRRKKRSDVKILVGENSSSSMNIIRTNVRRKSGSRMKQADGTMRPKTAEKPYVDSCLSNDADDEYMTQSSHDKCALP